MSGGATSGTAEMDGVPAKPRALESPDSGKRTEWEKLVGLTRLPSEYNILPRKENLERPKVGISDTNQPGGRQKKKPLICAHLKPPDVCPDGG